MTAADERRGFIDGLRAIASLLESTPDLPIPDNIGFDGDAAWNVWPSVVADVPAEVRRLRRLLPPAVWTKNDSGDPYDSQYYELSAPLHGLLLKICTNREQICERVVTGTREVTEEVPVAFETVTKTVETVEWVCKPLLVEVSS